MAPSFSLRIFYFLFFWKIKLRAYTLMRKKKIQYGSDSFEWFSQKNTFGIQTPVQISGKRLTVKSGTGTGESGPCPETHGRASPIHPLPARAFTAPGGARSLGQLEAAGRRRRVETSDPVVSLGPKAPCACGLLGPRLRPGMGKEPTPQTPPLDRPPHTAPLVTKRRKAREDGAGLLTSDAQEGGAPARRAPHSRQALWGCAGGWGNTRGEGALGPTSIRASSSSATNRGSTTGLPIGNKGGWFRKLGIYLDLQ